MATIAPMPTRASRAAEAPAPGPRAVILEAPSLPELARQLDEWAAAHPQHEIISFSHARETREVDRASLAGPATMQVYTGVLLVRTVPREQESLEVKTGGRRL